jgi:tRNA dimethylallyltransferase
MQKKSTDAGLNPLVMVLGPTGAGKSVLALDIAERFGGEIVNCDSLQLYRGFDIGTAKTPLREQRGIPHHFIDVLDEDEIFTAGDYARLARPVIHDISGRDRLPIVAGGTGFYARALLEGLFEGPSRDDEQRRDLSDRERRRTGFLHRALSRLDPTAAARIHPNDHKKLIRALEVCLLARRPMSALLRGGRTPLAGFKALKLILNPPRTELQHKLNERCAHMLEGGLIEEVKHLLSTGISSHSKPFESIGYKEVLGFLSGALSREEALVLMQRDTRRYAKRQLTWFRREAGAHWLSGFGSDPEVRSSAMNMLVKFLQTSRGA